MGAKVTSRGHESSAANPAQWDVTFAPTVFKRRALCSRISSGIGLLHPLTTPLNWPKRSARCVRCRRPPRRSLQQARM